MVLFFWVACCCGCDPLCLDGSCCLAFASSRCSLMLDQRFVYVDFDRYY